MVKRKGFVLLPVVVGLTLIAAIAYYLTREGAMNVDINSSEIKIADARNIAEAGFRYKQQQLESLGCTGYSTAFETVNIDINHSFSVKAGATGGTNLEISSDGIIGDTKVNVSNPNTAIYSDFSQLATFTKGNGLEDTFIDSQATIPNTGATTLKLFGGTGLPAKRPLLYFDISTIPQGSTVITAKLTMTVPTAPLIPATVGVYKLTSKWDSMTATWALTDGKFWANGAFSPADYVAPATPSSNLYISTTGQQNFDVKGLVSEWVNNPSTNHGLVLAPTTNTADIAFASNETTTSTPPSLEVTYKAPRKHILLKGNTGQDSYIAVQDTGGTGGASRNVAQNNFGDDPELVLDNGGKVAHPLIKFDLSSIPAGAKLNYANLILTVSTMPGEACIKTTGIVPYGTAYTSVHKMLQDWKEGTGKSLALTNNGVSWEMADKSSTANWAFAPNLPVTSTDPNNPFYCSNDSNVNTAGNTQGGNYDVTYDTKYLQYDTTFNPIDFYKDPTNPKIAVKDKITWNITNIMSEWLALTETVSTSNKDKKANFGLMVRADSALKQSKFYSFNNSDPQLHPRIELGYYMPCNALKPVAIDTYFTPVSIFKNQTSKLSIKLTNPNNTLMTITSGKNVLPPNLNFVLAGSITTTTPANCAGGTVSINTITVNSAQIAGGGSCIIDVNVNSSTPANYTNVILPNDFVTTLADAPTNPFISKGTLAVLAQNQVTLPSIADTAIWKSATLATSNCGVCVDLAVSTPNTNQVNSLFKFDLTSIPAASTITNAKLRLYVSQIVNRTAGQVLTLQASPLTASWLEGTDNVVTSTGGATWRRRSTALGNWGNQGGDFSTVNIATATIPATFAGTLGLGMWIEFDVTLAARAMLTSPAINFGFHVKETTVTTLSNEVRLAARENTSASGGWVPQLVISYQ